jgi:hypothetical protein
MKEMAILLFQHTYINYQDNAPTAAYTIWLTFAPLGWLFASAASIMLPLQERICGSRQLQVSV